MLFSKFLTRQKIVRKISFQIYNNVKNKYFFQICEKNTRKRLSIESYECVGENQIDMKQNINMQEIKSKI